jgi:hypothetical protein
MARAPRSQLGRCDFVRPHGFKNDEYESSQQGHENELPLALVGGIVIPLGYFFITSRLPLSHDNIKLLLLPVSWPSSVYHHFYPLDANHELVIFDGFETGNILSLVLWNVIVYSALTHALLFWLANSKE